MPWLRPSPGVSFHGLLLPGRRLHRRRERMNESNLRLEVAVDSPDGLMAAIEGGADRIELCSSLALGGLTPSHGLMALAAEAPMPVRVMIRPREGAFVYSDADRATMMRDIDVVRTLRLAGIVMGANDANGGLDLEFLSDLAARAQGINCTLHRSVDLMPDPRLAVDQAIALGFSTILTSGGANTAMQGLENIAAMRTRAGARIEIMAGGGVTPDNAQLIVRQTGIHWLHSSCATPTESVDKRAKTFGFEAPMTKTTSSERVRELMTALRLMDDAHPTNGA